MREQRVWDMTEADRVKFLVGLRVGDVVTVPGEGRCDVVELGDDPVRVNVRTQVGLVRRVYRVNVTGRWA
jgi:hypothetical protein